MSKDKPVYELLIDENFETLETISFVEYPAIQENFMYFSKDKPKFKFKKDEGDKFMVTGPAMIPNQKIFRVDETGNEFEVFFSEETIVKANELFFKNSNHTESNIDHSRIMLDGVTVVESWIIEDPENDKSNALGFSNMVKGTWMVSYKVDNEDLWEKIKDGEVNGFSIEGFFMKELTALSKQDKTENKEDETWKAIGSILDDKTLSDDTMYDKLKEVLK